MDNEDSFFMLIENSVVTGIRKSCKPSIRYISSKNNKAKIETPDGTIFLKNGNNHYSDNIQKINDALSELCEMVGNDGVFDFIMFKLKL